MCSKLLIIGAVLAGSITTHAADWLTEEFNYFNFDLNGVAVTFTPEGDTNYTISAEAITNLPVDLANEPDQQPIVFLDYDRSTVTALTTGTFPYFGTYYDIIHVSPNGWITFDFGERDQYPSLQDHFDQLRISLFWAHLHPWEGGDVTLTRTQNPDRYVITYQDVFYISGNANQTVTAQCELFIDDGTIRLSWIDTYVNGYPIVGLSAAQGYDSSYEETDLSSYMTLTGDTDEDGIPDTWEVAYFDHITNCNPLMDFDFDSFTNYEEYIAGTHPKDDASYFHITSMQMMLGSTPEMIFNWNAATGRFYIVKHTDTLSAGYSNLAVVAHPQSSYTSSVDAVEGYYKVEVDVVP
jgi:hypothetical protein